MTGLTKRIVLTAVELLVVTCLAPAAMAQAKPGVNVTLPPKDCPVGKTRPKMKPGEDAIAYSQSECTIDDCTGLYKAVVKEPLDKMNQACREAGLGADCRKQIQKCMDPDVASTGDSEWLQKLMPSLSQAGNSLTGTTNFSNLGSSLKSEPKGCSNLSDRDYFDKKDRLDRDLKDAEEKAANLKNDAANDTEKLNEKVKVAQEKIGKAQEDLSDKKQKLDEQKRDAAEKVTKGQEQIANDLAALNNKERQIRAEVAAKEEEWAGNMINMRIELAEAACMIEVRGLRDQLDKTMAFKSGSNWGSELQKRQASLQAKWDSCIAGFNNKRLAMEKNRKTFLEDKGQSLAEIQAMRQAADDRTKNLKTESDAAIASLDKAGTDAEQRLATQMQNAQSQLMAANQTTQTKSNALRDKQLSLTNKISQLNADIAKLGPQPKPGAKGGWRDAQGAVLTYLQGEATYCENVTCAKEKRDLCGSKSSQNTRKALIEKIQSGGDDDDDDSSGRR